MTFYRTIKVAYNFSIDVEYDQNYGVIRFSGRNGSHFCGSDELRNISYGNLSSEEREQLRVYWKRYHRNDNTYGTPAQEDAIFAWMEAGNEYGVRKAQKHLESIGLLYDGDYKYASKKFTEEIPREVLEWVFNLPGHGHTAEDIYPYEIDEDAFLVFVGAT